MIDDMMFAANGDGNPAERADKRRHKSLLVVSNLENHKWLNEYSGFNLQELQESMIENAQRTASQYTKNETHSNNTTE